MKITTHIDEKLLANALKATRARSQREVLEMGLRQVLKESRSREFAKNLHRFDVAWTHDGLMKSRS